jgi:hydroxymethylglutaryl-CoA lyase
MNHYPKAIHIHEEGPREGFQIEPGPISTADKVKFIEALANTGLKEVQAVSFVNPKRVPGMADAEEVARLIRRQAGVKYTSVWLNLQGLERALQSPLDVYGRLQISASESFSIKNTGKNTQDTLREQRQIIEFCKERNLSIDSAIVMTAFGCNIEGEIKEAVVIEKIKLLVDLLQEYDMRLPYLRLADTVGWANPRTMDRVISSVQDRWPDLQLGLHLHDTRGTGLANALVGLSKGIEHFDSSCAGLGGCPFAGHKGAAGNICTEDLVFMCEEMGIATGVDLDALIECAHMAESIVGHSLPGKVMRGGSLSKFKSHPVG